MSDYMLIPLHGKHGEGKFARVSPEDFDRCSKIKWTLNDGYAISSGFIKGKRMLLHRFIRPIPFAGCVVDHINRDRLDNRRENLRDLSPRENSRNSIRNKSGVPGVSWSKAAKKWTAVVAYSRFGKTYQRYLGVFNTIEEARNKRDSFDRLIENACIRTHSRVAA